MRLVELFDTKSEIIWTEQNEYEWECSFKVNEVVYFFSAKNRNVRINKTGDLIQNGNHYIKSWAIEFGVSNISSEFSGGEYRKQRWGNTGNQQNSAAGVFGKVINILLDFIKKGNPNSFFFDGSKVENRSNLYNSMIKKLTPKLDSMGYQLYDQLHAGLNKYVRFIFRKKDSKSISEEVIMELFDTETSIKWTVNSQYRMGAYFSVGDERFAINFERRYDPEEWEVSFSNLHLSYPENFQNTNLSREKAFKVFSKVIMHIRAFLIEKKPYALILSGTLVGGKADMYRKMINHLSKKLNNMGYTLEEEYIGDCTLGKSIFFKITKLEELN